MKTQFLLSLLSAVLSLIFYSNFDINNFSVLLAITAIVKSNIVKKLVVYNSHYKFRLKVPLSILAPIHIEKPVFRFVATLIRDEQEQEK